MIRDEHPRGLSRRTLIGGATAGAVLAGALATETAAQTTTGGPDLPQKLVPGDLVVVPAPGGPSNATAVGRGIAILESWGCASNSPSTPSTRSAPSPPPTPTGSPTSTTRSRTPRPRRS